MHDDPRALPASVGVTARPRTLPTRDRRRYRPSLATTGTTPRDVLAQRIREVPQALMARAHLDELPVSRSEYVVGDLDDPLELLPAEARVVVHHVSDQRVVAELPGAMIMIRTQHGSTFIEVLGRDRATADAVADRAVALAGELATPPPPTKARISMWWCDREPVSISRGIDAPSWNEIQLGYPDPTQGVLARLMAMTEPGERSGRLVLWHGAPGTGKTTAVRALAREWSSWCDVHYISDPEKLFAVPGYLLTVAGNLERGNGERWRLLVAEDCDEYLRTDAKHRAGASLGRLLNLSDGILGNGLRVLVLLSTNEDVGRLHPAITRPGRCLNQLRFERFDRAQAQRWLGPDLVPTADELTLAELFAIKRGVAEDGAGRESVPVGLYL